MTDTAEYELIELRRQDKPDIAFEGRLLAFADNKDEAEANHRKSAARWTELSVYELRDGSWVAVTEAISDKPGEVDFANTRALTAGDVFGAMEFFGWTWLAKRLAVDAGWDARISSVDCAKARIDKHFGFGRDAAHQILRTNAEAKRIYDCAVMALQEAEAELEALRSRGGRR